MLQLNRFTFDMATLRRKKLNHRVAFPMQLDMAPYCREGGALASADGGVWYDCLGLLLHSGSVRCLI